VTGVRPLQKYHKKAPVLPEGFNQCLDSGKGQQVARQQINSLVSHSMTSAANRAKKRTSDFHNLQARFKVQSRSSALDAELLL
jgi:hypothetical protein